MDAAQVSVVVSGEVGSYYLEQTNVNFGFRRRRRDHVDGEQRIRDIENQVPQQRVLAMIGAIFSAIFVILLYFIPTVTDIIWGYYILYVAIYPLSRPARFLYGKTAFFVFEFLWSMVTVSWNSNAIFGVVALVSKKMRSATRSRLDEAVWRPIVVWKPIPKFLTWPCKVLGSCVLYAIATSPLWWRWPGRVVWQRSAWRNEVCAGWDYQIIFNTVDFQEIGLDEPLLSNASFLSQDGRTYLMQLAHPTSNISLISVEDESSTPFTVKYNFTDSTYLTSIGVSGNFTNYPLLAFPSLSLSSRYPKYPWRTYCGAPTVALIDQGGVEVLRTSVSNYDDPTMLKVCGRGNKNELSIPLGAVLIEMEKAGICATNPFGYKIAIGYKFNNNCRVRLNDSDPTIFSNDTTCEAVSKYLYAVDESIIPNPDISGIGNRITIYVQAALNNIIALSEHTKDEAVAVNTANSLAIFALTFASGYVDRPDWPHLIIIYHFILMISFSSVSYLSIPPGLRSSSDFIPLLERLTAIDIIAMPFFLAVTLVLWIGIPLARRRLYQLPKALRFDCLFGNWVFFGKSVNLQTTRLIWVAVTWAAIVVAWVVFSKFIDAIGRRDALKRAQKVVAANPTAPDIGLILAEAKIGSDGDHCSAWIWHRLIGERFVIRGFEFRLRGFRVGFRGIRFTFRKLVFLWRLCIWVYLIADTEQIILANDLTDENTLTYGQVFPLVLLVVPFGVIWRIFYRESRLFRERFDSPTGQYTLLYTFSNLIWVQLATVVQPLTDRYSLFLAVYGFLIASYGVPLFMRLRYARKFQRLLGVANYTEASSVLDIWTVYQEIRIFRSVEPPSSGVQQDLAAPEGQGVHDDTQPLLSSAAPPGGT